MTEILIFISSNFAFEIYSKHGNIRVRVKEKTITKGDLHTAQWKIRCTLGTFFSKKKKFGSLILRLLFLLGMVMAIWVVEIPRKEHIVASSNARY